MTTRRPLIACLLILTLGGSACGQAQRRSPRPDLAGTSITFSINVEDAEVPALQELLRRFEERTRSRADLEPVSRFRDERGVRVELVRMEADATIERLRREAQENKPRLHLFAQDNLALSQLVDEALVQDLSSVPVPPPVLGSMVPPKFGARQFFLPFRPNVRLAYAHKEALTKAGVSPPRSAEEVKTAAQKLKGVAGGVPKVTLSLADGAPAAVTVSEWILSFGGDPLVLNDEGSIQALEFLQQLWREGMLASGSLLAKYDTEVAFLADETSWLAQNWAYTSAELSKKDKLQGFEVYPGWRGPARAAHVIGGDVLGVPRAVTGKEKDAALELAQFLMSREAQELLAERNAWPSIRADAYARVPRALKKTFVAIQEALEDGWYRPSVPYWPEVSSAMNEAIRRTMLGGEPVKPVLAALHAKVAAAAREKGVEYPSKG